MATAKKTLDIKVGKEVVVISNPQKIYWPEQGYTKGDVVAYYEKMAPYILPFIKDRPLSLKRNPNGIKDKGFFHKDAGEDVPDYIEVFKVTSESNGKVIDYIVCNNKATLLYLANLGCIEIDPWNSTQKKPDHPTWMVIDIDPSDSNPFTQVVDVALATKAILDKAGLAAYCKTSGSTGLHVYVPMKNKYPFEEVKEFAKLVATKVQEQLPKISTLERSLSKRGPKIYIDYLQNRNSQTIAAVYSLRPVAAASVSTPVLWEEVAHSLDPAQFNLTNIFERVEKYPDLFKEVLTGSSNLGAAMKLLG
ncbi:MAG: ligD [Ferruginibacter sp.]|nr:ligD [Ferruginibacter sp.]